MLADYTQMTVVKHHTPGSFRIVLFVRSDLKLVSDDLYCVRIWFNSNAKIEKHRRKGDGGIAGKYSTPALLHAARRSATKQLAAELPHILKFEAHVPLDCWKCFSFVEAQRLDPSSEPAGSSSCEHCVELTERIRNLGVEMTERMGNLETVNAALVAQVKTLSKGRLSQVPPSPLTPAAGARLQPPGSWD